MKKLVASLALVPAFAAGSLVATTGTADAALPSNTVRRASLTGLSCSGKVLTSKSAYVKGKTVGVLTLYVRDANRGTVIACFKHAGVTMRRSYPTAVAIVATNSKTATKPVVSVSKRLVTKTVAGPVAVNHVKILTHCVAAAGAIQISGKWVQVNSSQYCYVRVPR